MKAERYWILFQVSWVAPTRLAIKLRHQSYVPELDGSWGISYALTASRFKSRNLPAVFAIFGQAGTLRLDALRVMARLLTMTPK